MDRPKSKRLSSLWLSHSLLIVATTLAWNLLALGNTVYVHKYMQRWDWWWVLALLTLTLLSALFGLLYVHPDALKNEIAYEYTPKKRWPLPLRTGFVTFLIGWIPCAFIVLRMNALDGWCDMGILGAIIGDWLPIGLAASVIAAFVSWNITKKIIAPEDSTNFK